MSNDDVKRKKIALCLEYPLALRGGVSVLVEVLLSGLAKHFDLVLVSPDTSQSLADSQFAPLLAAHVPWRPETVSPASSRELARQMKLQGIDLAHFHFGGNFGWGNRFPGHCPIPYLSRSGVPTCSTIHLVVDVFDGYCGRQKPFWFKLAFLPVAWAGKMQVLSHLRREIAVSQHDAQKLRRWYWPMRGKYVQIYHSRLPAGPPDRTNPVRERVILNVGHIAWRKGQGLLAEAFARIAPRHPEWKLQLVGHVAEEAEANRIKETARKNNLEDRIVLVGGRKDAFDLMSNAAIYVQPSYEEALGLALQEAMFYGCPSIGCRVGGIPELIEHQKTGLLVEPGNVSQLAEAIESFIVNSATREAYGVKGAASILQRGMTAEQMLQRHVELYEAILRGL